MTHFRPWFECSDADIETAWYVKLGQHFLTFGCFAGCAWVFRVYVKVFRVYVKAQGAAFSCLRLKLAADAVLI